MHKTTRAMLKAIAEANNNDDYTPAQCWGHIGQAVFDWREAGQPDQHEGMVPIDAPPATDARLPDYDLLSRKGRESFRKKFSGLMMASLPWKIVQSVILWGGEVWAKPEYRIYTAKDHPQSKSPAPILTTIEIDGVTYLLMDERNATYIKNACNTLPGLLRRLDDTDEALVRALNGDLSMAHLAVEEPERLAEVTKMRDRLFAVARLARKDHPSTREWRVRAALSRVGELEKLLGLVDDTDPAT
jgi:hypothetical protein